MNPRRNSCDGVRLCSLKNCRRLRESQKISEHPPFACSRLFLILTSNSWAISIIVGVLLRTPIRLLSALSGLEAVIFSFCLPANRRLSSVIKSDLETLFRRFSTHQFSKLCARASNFLRGTCRNFELREVTRRIMAEESITPPPVVVSRPQFSLIRGFGGLLKKLSASTASKFAILPECGV